VIRTLPLLLLGAACAEPEWDHVAPVVESRCLGCHGPDGASPPLHRPEVLSGLAPSLVAELEAGTMPAWAPDDAEHPLRDRLAMPESERRLLLRWLDAGAHVPPGATLTAPPRPRLDADLLLDVPAHDVSGESLRCFLVDLPQASMTGFDVVGSAVVHHALLGVHPASARADLAARDAADPGPGWDCPDAFMPQADPVPVRVPVLWFPSPAPTRTFPGTGVPLGGVGVVQVHALGAGTARGRLELSTAPSDQVAEEISLPLGTGYVSLPDDRDEHVLVRRTHLGTRLPEGVDGPVRVLGARGHGHHLLSRLTVRVDEQLVLDLARWDPRMQPRYLLQEPLLADADAVVELTCIYDLTPQARARAADYGEEDEMCGGWLFVTPAGTE